MGTGTFYPEKTKFFSGLKVPVPRVPSITTSGELYQKFSSLALLAGSKTLSLLFFINFFIYLFILFIYFFFALFLIPLSLLL